MSCLGLHPAFLHNAYVYDVGMKKNEDPKKRKTMELVDKMVLKADVSIKYSTNVKNDCFKL